MKWMLVLVLAGCGSAPLAPHLVEVPVFTPCVKVVPERPSYEFDKLLPRASDGEIILALSRDWLRGRRYEGMLEVIIVGCESSVLPTRN